MSVSGPTSVPLTLIPRERAPEPEIPKRRVALPAGCLSCGHGEVDPPRGGAALVAAVGFEVGVVRDLIDEPVFGGIGFADGEVDVVGEELGVLDVLAPVPVVVAVAELFGGAVGGADLPELLAEVGGVPLDGAEVEFLAGRNGDGGGGVVCAEDAVGYGVELISAGADVGDGEGAVGCALCPELIVLGVVLPGDGLGREVEGGGSARGGVGRRFRG